MGEILLQRIKNKKNWISQYKILQNAIPKMWKEKLTNDSMRPSVKKQFRPFLTIDNKIEYDLPKKARDYYNIMKKKKKKKKKKKQVQKRTFLETHWNLLFPDRPIWSKVYEGRITKQKIKKYQISITNFYIKYYHVKKSYSGGNCLTLINVDLVANVQKTTTTFLFHVQNKTIYLKK